MPSSFESIGQGLDFARLYLVIFHKQVNPDLSIERECESLERECESLFRDNSSTLYLIALFTLESIVEEGSALFEGGQRDYFLQKNVV